MDLYQERKSKVTSYSESPYFGKLIDRTHRIFEGVFLQSGLPQQTLAHIWNLCDFDQSGKLNADQFSLAMWLVSNALKGIQPPTILAPEMVPPGQVAPQVHLHNFAVLIFQ